MRRLWLLPAAFLVLLGSLALNPAPAAAQGGSASEMIEAVNALRAADGLPALQVNSILMSIAQAQSTYQASIGSVTHTGPGGSRPGDRAAAAGYGGGATIHVSENIAGGSDLSPAGAVSLWQEDSLHLNTMLGSSYQDIGAGAAVAGDAVYYTLVVGYVAGSEGGGNSPAPPSASDPDGGGAASSVLVGVPSADGSVIHEVQSGETLIGIAVAYGLTVAELQELNELGTNTFIYPGDKLLIVPPFTPTPTPTPTITPTPPRPTRRPPPTATLTPESTQVVAVADAGDQAPEPGPGLGFESLAGEIASETDRGGLILGILAVAFILLISPVVIGMIKKRSRRQEN